MAFAIALSSCIYDDSPLAGNQTAIDSADTQITLYISMSNAATTRAGTRADDSSSTSTRGTTWGDSYNSADATTFETTISTLQVLFFNTDGSLAAVATQTALWSFTSNSNLQYEYIGTVTPTDTGFTDANSNSSTTTNADGTTTTSFTGTVMVLANCPDATTTAYTTDDSGNITYTTSSSTSTNAPILIEDLLYDTDGNARTATSGSKLTDVECMAYLTYAYADVTEDTGLPMWGMATTDALTGTTGGTLTFTSGYNTSLGNIDLLRAMAKISVALSSDATSIGYAISSVTLDGGYNTSGLCLPSGYSSASQTKALDTENCVNIPTGVASSTDDLSFTSDDDATYLLYLPEMETTISTTTSDGTTTYTTTPYITVNLTDPDNSTLTKKLYLCDYDDDSQPTSTNYTLTRNHVYSYTLNTSQLLIATTESDWTEDEPSSVGWEVDDENITFVALNGSTTDANKGDVEARYCLVLYPEWNDDMDDFLDGSRANASFGFTLSPDAKFTTGTITWEAHLTNTEYFAFSYSELTSSEQSGVGLDYTAYNVSTGVNRENSYGIKVVCNTAKGQWYDSTDTSGNTIEGIRTTAVNSEYAIVDTSANPDTIIAVYTDLFILATGAGMTYPLKINPTEDRSNAIFTPNRFAGGTKDIAYIDSNSKHHTIGEHQWVRIYWAWPDTDRDTVLKKIMDASDDDEIWYPADD